MTPITVIGGGPVGLVLSLQLHKQGIPVMVLEALARKAGYQDGRALALSDGTRQALIKLGVWEALLPHATLIKNIHISQQKGLGRTVLKAQEQGLPALGYVVAYGQLMQALDTQVQSSGLNIQYHASVNALNHHAQEVEVLYQHSKRARKIRARLAVIADGGRSLNAVSGMAREVKEYGHDALVVKVVCEQAHQHTAYERFTPQGPMALLPNGVRDFSLVWTGEKSYVDSLLSLDDPSFLSQLHNAFGERVGRFLQVGKRMSFPLKLAKVSQPPPPCILVIGNAAQTMHPVAGQGFNVGIRDAWHLASLIEHTPEVQWGSLAMMQSYIQSRSHDTERGLWFTDSLIKVFSNDFLGVGLLRGAGLGLLSVLPPARRFLINKMSYGR